MVQNNTWLFIPIYCFRFVSNSSETSYFIQEFSGFGLLFSFHCSVCFCRFLLSATTSISYHKQLSLSRTFFEKLFDFFFWFFSGGLWLNTGIPSKIKVFRDRRSQRRVIIYHISSMVVNTFLKFFSSFLFFTFLKGNHQKWSPFLLNLHYDFFVFKVTFLEYTPYFFLFPIFM